MSRIDSSRELDRRLGDVLAAARLRVLLRGVVTVLGFGGGAVLLAALSLGAMDWPPLWLQRVLAGMCLIVLGGVATLEILLPLRRLGRRARLVNRLDADGRGNLLVAAEEVLRRPDRWYGRDRITEILTGRVIDRALESLDGLRIGRRMPLAAPALGLGTLVLALAGFVAALQLGPETLSLGTARLAASLGRSVDATAGRLLIDQEVSALTAGDDIDLAVIDFAPGLEAPVCEIRRGDGLWQEVVCHPDSIYWSDDSCRWLHSLADLRESFSYRFKRGSDRTVTRELTVRHHPLLSSLGGRVIPPPYTKLPSRELSRMPAGLEVIAGSRLVWDGRLNHPVVAADMIMAGGDTMALTASQDSLRGEMIVREPLHYTIELLDEFGLRNATRLAWDVAVRPDRAPLAALSRPDGLTTLPIAGEVQLRASAADDFGLGRLDLLFRKEGPSAAAAISEGDPEALEAAWQRLGLWAADVGEIPSEPWIVSLESDFGYVQVEVGAEDGSALEIRLDLALLPDDLRLIAGDVLVLCLEVHDNRVPAPANTARSGLLRLAMPSAADLLSERAAEGEGDRATLEELQTRSEDLSRDLERLDRELLKEPLPDFARKQEIEGALDRQRELQDELSRLAEGIEENLDEMARDNMTSMELLEKMDQVAELMQDLNSPELKAMLDQLREEAGQLSEGELRRAVEEAARNQQEMVDRLDRAVAMLEQMMREQELEGINSLLERLMKQQQELLAETRRDAAEAADKNEQEASGEDSETAAGESPEDDASAEDRKRRQEALAEELESLEQRIEEALAELADKKPPADGNPSIEQMKEALEKALEQMKEQGAAEDMQQAAESMESGDESSASESQSEALEKMASLYSVLLKSQQAMQMAMQNCEATSLRRIAAEMIDLSQRQEDVAAEIPVDLINLRIEDLVQRQFHVLQALRRSRDDLRALSSGAPMQMIKLIQELGDVIITIDEAVSQMESRHGRRAGSTATAGLGALNQLVIGLLTRAQQTGGGGGSCSMPSLGQQLREMARQQAGLNGLAQELRQQMQGGLSQEMRAQMERLRGEQSGMAGQMSELADEQRRMRDGERVLGDLEQLAQEMERISRDLSTGMISRETIARQERILGRLLDAHNSVREREFGRRRESRTATGIHARQQGQEMDETDRQEGRPFLLRRRAVEEAPLEYRELVRRYFQSIEALRGTEEAPRDGGAP